ncbi:MAG: hypothetical protein EGS44_05175 [Akkermansia muciniphila]|nr:hypothetical protein [Akkermansia muciniphila]
MFFYYLNYLRKFQPNIFEMILTWIWYLYQYFFIMIGEYYTSITFFILFKNRFKIFFAPFI